MKVNKEIFNGFQPIKIEIAIETKQEMEDLLARLNVNSHRLNELSKNNTWQADSNSSQELFDLLSDEWANRNYGNKEDY